jgi:ABC-2 type transport system permease protein
VPAVLAWVAAGLPFLGLGLAIGYRLSSKAALAVANVLLLPLAFGGGLFLPPQLFPGWLDTASTFLPSRAGRDLLVGTVTGDTIPMLSIAVLLAWTALALGLAVLAYRRDEGQRFR